MTPTSSTWTHAATNENKRLNAVLAYARELQEANAPTVKVVGKQRTRYQPKGEPHKPRKSWMDGRAARRAEEAAQASPALPLAAE